MKKFVAGLFAGLVVIFVEIQLFIANLVFNAISTTLVNSQNSSLFFGVSISLIIITMGGIIQNFLIGYFRPTFALGFFVGNLIIIFFLGGALFNTIPIVLFGLILICFSVLAGIFLRPSNY